MGLRGDLRAVLKGILEGEANFGVVENEWEMEVIKACINNYVKKSD